MPPGYYRFPTIAADNVVFTCEDDLWEVSAQGGVPRRLTAGQGEATHACLSPDGRMLAFTGREEGHMEVFVLPLSGGEPRRLTFLGATTYAVGFTPDGDSVVFSSNAKLPFAREYSLFSVPVEGGVPIPLAVGPARHVAFGPGGSKVLGRNTGFDPARWKRYKGGTAGDLWVDGEGDGRFKRLNPQLGNPTTPLWVGDRIYFLADHEGHGNLYSCLKDGSAIRRHTDHHKFYARQASSDGKRIVYQAGGALYLFDPATDSSAAIPIDWQSPAPQRSRKFVSASHFLDGAALHPKGHSLAITTRGKAFAFGNWAGPVAQLGALQGVRYRLPVWLHDGEKIAAVSDELGEETLVSFRADGVGATWRLEGADIGRVVEMAASPTSARVALANHRHELLMVDLDAGSVRLIERSPHARLTGLAWSPDGEWVAYGFPNSPKTTCIKLAHAERAETHQVTAPVLHDYAPAFDSKGEYLYFISQRIFDPVYDGLHFDLGFPKGSIPCLLTLRKELPSPFVPRVEEGEPPADEKNSNSDADNSTPPALRIDFDGIQRRLVAFPVPEGKYHRVLGIGGKVLFSSSPPLGALASDEWPAPPPEGKLEILDFRTQKTEILLEGVTDFSLSKDGKALLVTLGERLRVLSPIEKPKPDAPQEAGRESGFVDLERARVGVEPAREWTQMFDEAWRLQQHQFWSEDMSQVNWLAVRDTYRPLLERISTRSELSDLLWEIHGELGTSHAYEMGGEYRQAPRYDQGQLGAEFVYDALRGGYRLTRIIMGDPGESKADSPLNRVGQDIQVGDVLLAVAGQRLGPAFPPEQALVHQARMEVQLIFAGREPGDPERVCSIKTTGGEWKARYREWVENNRKHVHEASAGRIGYVHIPDMGPLGYAEFHRGYLAECERDGLIVDVRYNGGGHVSQLILEKLARKRVGFDVERWGALHPYPSDSVGGPLVALTNEHAGSDGDIFCHCFKLMGLGPLLGKRTWGGVIGIEPRHALVDGTVTTQPEFSFWFEDVGWGVENYGTEPDLEVDNAPQDYARGVDTQLDTAIDVALKRLASHPPLKPDFSRRPSLAVPALPARGR